LLIVSLLGRFLTHFGESEELGELLWRPLLLLRLIGLFLKLLQLL